LSLGLEEEIRALQSQKANQGLQLFRMQVEGKEWEKEGEEQAASKMVVVKSSIQDPVKATDIIWSSNPIFHHLMSA